METDNVNKKSIYRFGINICPDIKLQLVCNMSTLYDTDIHVQCIVYIILEVVNTT